MQAADLVEVCNCELATVSIDQERDSASKIASLLDESSRANAQVTARANDATMVSLTSTHMQRSLPAHSIASHSYDASLFTFSGLIMRKNKSNNSDSHSITQSIAANNNIELASANAETFYIRKGANGSLPCLPIAPTDSSAIKNKIEWFKEDRKLIEAENKRVTEWNLKNRIAYLADTGALLFRTVTNEDSGEYRCEVSKPGSDEAELGIVRFFVQGKLFSIAVYRT